ncbi:MAG: hypothetical protein QM724_10165 [Flavobacteriales bacterium]
MRFHKNVGVLLAVIASCGLFRCHLATDTQDPLTADTGVLDPPYAIDGLEERFAQLVAHPSTDTLEQLFSEWNASVPPNTPAFIGTNDTISSVFAVYRAFYEPYDLLSKGAWEWGNGLNEDSKYVGVQNKILYAVSPDGSAKTGMKYDSILDFRPPLDIEQGKVLYLTPTYASALLHFLGAGSTEAGTPNIMDPSRPDSTSERRYAMIRPFLPILHGHWGGYWHLETHPEVYAIVFDPALTTAEVNFRVGYQGGAAILKRSGRDWHIESSKATWIE